MNPSRRPTARSPSGSGSRSGGSSRSRRRSRRGGWKSRAGHAATALVAGLFLAGCGEPPELAERQPVNAPPAAIDATPSSPVSLPPFTASPGTGYPHDQAVRCDDQFDPDRVLELLRAEQLLDPDTSAAVGEGPLCAADWHFTVITVPDLDPLRVVTRGPPEQPELVTAGTEVCSVEVRVQAPPGIRAAADCVS